ncbi:GNVR domain-containing protein [Spirosoma sordidisoli]|uniref:GNVR domain-containing protein n=1 Tax=Spirosoma sordidisoli TaxID=2502893 RepID=UPI0013EDCE1A|nr:GNVR domain-containing protein [Spirosoma sordidisoli]
MTIHPKRLAWAELSPETSGRVLWANRRLVWLTGLAGALLGVAVALLLRPEYAAGARVMPELTDGSGDRIRQLASVAGFSGFDLSDGTDTETIRPDLYPNILQSTPFLLALIDQRVRLTQGDTTTVGQLIRPERSLVAQIGRWFGAGSRELAPPARVRPGQPIRLSMRQKALIEAVGERVSARFDTRSGIITITARMPDASASATVAQLAMDYLQQYVVGYRTEKARQDLLFYHRQLADARQRYQTAQLRLFRHNDQHQRLFLQTATLERQRLTDELTLAQGLYTELARRYEQARLKVQERTPVFKVLEPPTVPLERVSPKRTLLVLLFGLGGLALGAGYVLIRAMDWRSWLDRPVHKSDTDTPERTARTSAATNDR